MGPFRGSGLGGRYLVTVFAYSDATARPDLRITLVWVKGTAHSVLGGGGKCRAVREHRPSTSGGGLSRGSRDDHIMITPAEKISGDEVNIPICRSCVVCFVDESCSDRGFIVLGASLSAIISKKTHLASLSLPVSTSVRSRFLRVMIISIYLSTLSICGCTCPGSGYHGAVSAE